MIDVLVEEVVIVETKSLETYHPIYDAQCLTYLRQTNKRLGLVINFGALKIKEGIYRIVNKLNE